MIEIAGLAVARAVCVSLAGAATAVLPLAGAHSQSADEYTPTPLCRAIMAGETDGAMQLIEQGADVNAEFGCALVAAAGRAQLEVVDLLLDRGADPNHRVTGELTLYFGGSTPLQSAVQSRDVRVVELLLERGAEAHVDHAAFEIVINFGDIAMAQLLLDHGADPNVLPPEDTPIFANVRERQVLIPPKDLASDRIDATAQRFDCELAGPDHLLHWALFGFGVAKPEDRLEIAKLLLEHGADPNARNINGTTPLMESARLQRHALIMMLLEAGADAGAADRCGRTAEDYAGIFANAAGVSLESPPCAQTLELLRAGTARTPE
jgi:ankyrin repeat protein